MVTLPQCIFYVSQISKSASCPCCNNTCKNGAFCVPNNEMTRQYKCVCDSGWKGDNCDTMIGICPKVSKRIVLHL